MLLSQTAKIAMFDKYIMRGGFETLESFEETCTEVLEMVRNEIITEGMIPKINACLDAVNNGVTAVGIINGTKPHSCLWEIFSDKGSGTLIRQ